MLGNRLSQYSRCGYLADAEVGRLGSINMHVHFLSLTILKSCVCLLNADFACIAESI